MTLLSNTFAIFILATLAVYYLCPKKNQWICLLTASIVFYAFSGVGNFIFILGSSLVTFFAAKIVAKMNNDLKTKKLTFDKETFKIIKHSIQNKKRLVLVGMLFLNIGILFYLKYWRVLIGSKTLLLPLGISYYTLQAIGYFMDVYNAKIEKETNFAKFFLFISFFPQLIMGPINRYGIQGEQLKKEHKFDFENIKHGTMLVLFGAMKKYVVANLLVTKISAILDKNYDGLPGCVILFAILMYSVYQYADFCGGIDMFMGVAELFGIKMQPNFKQPYFSVSIANFWQRWHISLGQWMRDYVFYPFALTKMMGNLGKWCASHLGKHFGRVLPACIANILVFMLVGIWHGPELHFFVWGLYNGLLIALSDILKPAFKKMNEFLHINEKSKWFHLFRIIRTFILVNIGWYFDRIENVKQSFIYLKDTFVNFGNPIILTSKSYLRSIIGAISNFESHIILIFIGTLIIFVISLFKENKIDVYKAIQKKNIAIRWSAYYFLIILVILSFTFSSGDTGFMYAQY